MNRGEALMQTIEHEMKRVEEAFVLAIHEALIDTPFGVETFFSFERMGAVTGLERDMVRALCRRLTNKGDMTYSNTLWTENGTPAGAGYGLSRLGVLRAEHLLKEAE